MKSFKTEGIVIRRKNFGEADRILTLFTKDKGKIKILAKGVRRISSRRGPNIELFNQVRVSIHRGKNFDILTEAEVLSTFQSVRKSLDIVGLAFHICEIVDGLCPERQSHPRVYEMMLKLFNELDKGLINSFEQSLLEELGYLPKQNREINTTSFIESILEKKLKAKRLISKL